MNRLSNNLLVILIAAGLGTASLIWLATMFSMVQAILGLVVILVLPGYVLVELLMGRRTLGTSQHLFMSLITSVAIAILGSLLLNQLPLGVRLDSWVALYVSATAGGGLLAWLLRNRRRGTTTVTHRVPVRISQLVFIGVAVAIAAEALMLAHAPAAPENYTGYTMMWLTPVQGEAANQLQLGIDSKEFASTQYKLELRVDGQIAQEWATIELAPNQQWHASLALSEDQMGSSTLEANLYRLDRPDELYRHVVMRPRLSLASATD
jgi:uncharacterized membrane protein